jgi:outer membrane protein assembly factor BamB
VASFYRRIVGLSGAFATLALLAACGEREVILQGERLPIDAPLGAADAATAAAPAAASKPISLPGQQRNPDWGQRGGNVRHAAPHAALSAAPQLAWAMPIGQGESRRSRIAAAPVVAGGRIFTMDAGSTVSAVSTGGALLWQADLTASFDKGGGISGGGLAAEGGVLYATTAYGEVVALDPPRAGCCGGSGWTARPPAPPRWMTAWFMSRAATAAPGQWRRRTARSIWWVPGTPASAGYLGAAAPTVTPRAVIYPNAAGDLMAVLKIGGGTKLWQESLAGKRPGRAYAQSYDITGDAVLVGSTLYAGTGAGRTVAKSADTGETLWSAVEGAMAPPVVAGGSVFLVNDEAQVVRLDAATGSVIWAADMPYFQAEKPKKHKAIYAHFGPVLAGGKLWVASSDGVLRGFSPVNGALLAQAEIPGGAATQPAVAGGTLYVVSRNGQLLAFR